MRRHSDLHQSAAISAVLLVLLFALPLAVVVPFQTSSAASDVYKRQIPLLWSRSGSLFSQGTWTERWC